MAGLTNRLHRELVNGATAQSQAVVLTSRAWGHEGGNDITAEFVNPGVRELAAHRERSPATTSRVSLATDASGRAHEHRGAGRRGDQRSPARRDSSR